MKVAVGSTNPVKVNAVREIFTRVWSDLELCPVAVSSGISEMPYGDELTIMGARNRAMAARDSQDAQMGVGLEGGVHQESFGLVLQGWVVIVDDKGREGIGAAARLPLPPLIADRVLAGEELGPLMDELLEDDNTKQKGGAVGALTGGLVSRRTAFAIAVAYALAPFVSPAFYAPPAD